MNSFNEEILIEGLTERIFTIGTDIEYVQHQSEDALTGQVLIYGTGLAGLLIVPKVNILDFSYAVDFGRSSGLLGGRLLIPERNDLDGTVHIKQNGDQELAAFFQAYKADNFPAVVQVPEREDLYSVFEIPGFNILDLSWILVQVPEQHDFFGPVKDSFTFSEKPFVNYGTSSVLETTSDGSERIMMGFDLSIIKERLDNSVINVKRIILELTFTSYEDEEVTINLFQYSDDWRENGITWSNQPNKGPLFHTQTVTISNGKARLDLTSFLISYLSNISSSQTTIPWSIVVETNLEVASIYSRETTVGPKFDVVWVDPTWTGQYGYDELYNVVKIRKPAIDELSASTDIWRSSYLGGKVNLSLLSENLPSFFFLDNGMLSLRACVTLEFRKDYFGGRVWFRPSNELTGIFSQRYHNILPSFVKISKQGVPEELPSVVYVDTPDLYGVITFEKIKFGLASVLELKTPEKLFGVFNIIARDLLNGFLSIPPHEELAVIWHGTGIPKNELAGDVFIKGIGKEELPGIFYIKIKDELGGHIHLFRSEQSLLPSRVFIEGEFDLPSHTYLKVGEESDLAGHTHVVRNENNNLGGVVLLDLDHEYLESETNITGSYIFSVVKLKTKEDLAGLVSFRLKEDLTSFVNITGSYLFGLVNLFNKEDLAGHTHLTRYEYDIIPSSVYFPYLNLFGKLDIVELTTVMGCVNILNERLFAVLNITGSYLFGVTNIYKDFYLNAKVDLYVVDGLASHLSLRLKDQLASFVKLKENDVTPLFGVIKMVSYDNLTSAIKFIAYEYDWLAGEVYIKDKELLAGDFKIVRYGSAELILDTTPPLNFDADFKIESLSETNDTFVVELYTDDEDLSSLEVYFDGMSFEVVEGISVGDGWYRYKERFTLRITAKFVSIQIYCRDNVWNKSTNVPSIKFMYPSGTVQAYGDLILDTTAPECEVVVNDGAAELYTSAVKLEFLRPSVDLIDVKIWGDFADPTHTTCGSTEEDAPWIPLPYVLFLRTTPSLGLKTFYFIFRDNVWNESEVYIIEIELVPLCIDVNELQYFGEEALVSMPLIYIPDVVQRNFTIIPTVDKFSITREVFNKHFNSIDTGKGLGLPRLTLANRELLHLKETQWEKVPVEDFGVSYSEATPKPKVRSKATAIAKICNTIPSEDSSFLLDYGVITYPLEDEGESSDGLLCKWFDSFDSSASKETWIGLLPTQDNGLITSTSTILTGLYDVIKETKEVFSKHFTTLDNFTYDSDWELSQPLQEAGLVLFDSVLTNEFIDSGSSKDKFTILETSFFDHVFSTDTQVILLPGFDSGAINEFNNVLFNLNQEAKAHDFILEKHTVHIDKGYHCDNTLIYSNEISQRDIIYSWEEGWPNSLKVIQGKNSKYGLPMYPEDEDYPYSPSSPDYGEIIYPTVEAYRYEDSSKKSFVAGTEGTSEIFHVNSSSILIEAYLGVEFYLKKVSYFTTSSCRIEFYNAEDDSLINKFDYTIFFDNNGNVKKTASLHIDVDSFYIKWFCPKISYSDDYVSYISSSSIYITATPGFGVSYNKDNINYTRDIYTYIYAEKNLLYFNSNYCNPIYLEDKDYPYSSDDSRYGQIVSSFRYALLKRACVNHPTWHFWLDGFDGVSIGSSNSNFPYPSSEPQKTLVFSAISSVEKTTPLSKQELLNGIGPLNKRAQSVAVWFYSTTFNSRKSSLDSREFILEFEIIFNDALKFYKKSKISKNSLLDNEIQNDSKWYDSNLFTYSVNITELYWQYPQQFQYLPNNIPVKVNVYLTYIKDSLISNNSSTTYSCVIQAFNKVNLCNLSKGTLPGSSRYISGISIYRPSTSSINGYPLLASYLNSDYLRPLYLVKPRFILKDFYSDPWSIKLYSRIGCNPETAFTFADDRLNHFANTFARFNTGDYLWQIPGDIFIASGNIIGDLLTSDIYKGKDLILGKVFTILDKAKSKESNKLFVEIKDDILSSEISIITLDAFDFVNVKNKIWHDTEFPVYDYFKAKDTIYFDISFEDQFKIIEKSLLTLEEFDLFKIRITFSKEFSVLDKGFFCENILIVDWSDLKYREALFYWQPEYPQGPEFYNPLWNKPIQPGDWDYPWDPWEEEYGTIIEPFIVDEEILHRDLSYISDEFIYFEQGIHISHEYPHESVNGLFSDSVGLHIKNCQINFGIKTSSRTPKHDSFSSDFVYWYLNESVDYGLQECEIGGNVFSAPSPIPTASSIKKTNTISGPKTISNIKDYDILWLGWNSKSPNLYPMYGVKLTAGTTGEYHWEHHYRNFNPPGWVLDERDVRKYAAVNMTVSIDYQRINYDPVYLRYRKQYATKPIDNWFILKDFYPEPFIGKLYASYGCTIPEKVWNITPKNNWEKFLVNRAKTGQKDEYILMSGDKPQEEEINVITNAFRDKIKVRERAWADSEKNFFDVFFFFEDSKLSSFYEDKGFLFDKAEILTPLEDFGVAQRRLNLLVYSSLFDYFSFSDEKLITLSSSDFSNFQDNWDITFDVSEKSTIDVFVDIKASFTIFDSFIASLENKILVQGYDSLIPFESITFDFANREKGLFREKTSEVGLTVKDIFISDFSYTIDLFGEDFGNVVSYAPVSFYKNDFIDVKEKFSHANLIKLKDAFSSLARLMLKIPLLDDYVSSESGIINVTTDQLGHPTDSWGWKYLYLYDEIFSIFKKVFSLFGEELFILNEEAIEMPAISRQIGVKINFWIDEANFLYDIGYICIWLQIENYYYPIDWIKNGSVDYTEVMRSVEWQRRTNCIGTPPGGWPPIYVYPPAPGPGPYHPTIPQPWRPWPPTPPPTGPKIPPKPDPGGGGGGGTPTPSPHPDPEPGTPLDPYKTYRVRILKRDYYDRTIPLNLIDIGKTEFRILNNTLYSITNDIISLCYSEELIKNERWGWPITVDDYDYPYTPDDPEYGTMIYYSEVPPDYGKSTNVRARLHDKTDIFKSRIFDLGNNPCSLYIQLYFRDGFYSDHYYDSEDKNNYYRYHTWKWLTNIRLVFESGYAIDFTDFDYSFGGNAARGRQLPAYYPFTLSGFNYDPEIHGPEAKFYIEFSAITNTSEGMPLNVNLDVDISVLSQYEFAYFNEYYGGYSSYYRYNSGSYNYYDYYYSNKLFSENLYYKYIFKKYNETYYTYYYPSYYRRLTNLADLPGIVNPFYLETRDKMTHYYLKYWEGAADFISPVPSDEYCHPVEDEKYYFIFEEDILPEDQVSFYGPLWPNDYPWKLNNNYYATGYEYFPSFYLYLEFDENGNIINAELKPPYPENSAYYQRYFDAVLDQIRLLDVYYDPDYEQEVVLLEIYNKLKLPPIYEPTPPYLYPDYKKYYIRIRKVDYYNTAIGLNGVTIGEKLIQDGHKTLIGKEHVTSWLDQKAGYVTFTLIVPSDKQHNPIEGRQEYIIYEGASIIEDTLAYYSQIWPRRYPWYTYKNGAWHNSAAGYIPFRAIRLIFDFNANGDIISFEISPYSKTEEGWTEFNDKVRNIKLFYDGNSPARFNNELYNLQCFYFEIKEDLYFPYGPGEIIPIGPWKPLEPLEPEDPPEEPLDPEGPGVDDPLPPPGPEPPPPGPGPGPGPFTPKPPYGPLPEPIPDEGKWMDPFEEWNAKEALITLIPVIDWFYIWYNVYWAVDLIMELDEIKIEFVEDFLFKFTEPFKFENSGMAYEFSRDFDLSLIKFKFEVKSIPFDFVTEKFIVGEIDNIIKISDIKLLTLVLTSDIDMQISEEEE